jgi:peptidoglycan/LPS O-acetylase OafA/YrhL
MKLDTLSLRNGPPTQSPRKGAQGERSDLEIPSGASGTLGNVASPASFVTTQNLDYRRDIDGLRAVAVLSVLGYHLGISWFRGGFVGVDVFFVISGYLIGSLILQDVSVGDFSLAGFYARRVRRIAPAFVLMAGSVAGLAYFLLLPAEYLRLAWSTLFAAFSMSNVYFSNHIGYFDAPAGTQILLHTWSLGVEEQFYLVFPWLVLLTTRYAPKFLVLCLGLLWIGSFGLSAVGAFENPQSTFFLAPARAWELLLGVLLAIQPWTAALSGRPRNLMALLGVAMIGVSIFVYSVETPFPGAAALVPCAGAALIIAAGQSGDSLVRRMLSLPPIVFIGLISYSLYLWHWPVIIFERSDAEFLNTPTRVLIIVYSFALAILSWQFVEKPFRRAKSVPDAQVIVRGLVGVGVLAIAAGFIIVNDGFVARFSPAARAYAGYLDYGQTHFREGSCFVVGPSTFLNFDREKCLRREDGRQNYLLIGDSHAAQLWYGLSELLDGVHVLQATTAGCKPQFAQAKAQATSCSRMMDYVFSDYLANNRVDRLLVAGRWVQSDLPRLEEVLNWARSRNMPVTLFGPMVEYDQALPRILAVAAQNNTPLAAESHRIKSNMALDSELGAIATKYSATYVSYYKLLCPTADWCVTTTPDGSPLEFDTDHLTKQGSLLVVRKMIEAGQLS